MNQGYLRISVTESRGNLPVAGAAVTVFFHSDEQAEHDKNQDTNKLFDEAKATRFLTASDGSVPVMTVETPDEALSLSENGMGIPCGLCDVRVEKDDYVTVITYGVQVFPGVESVLVVRLVPLVSGEEPTGIEKNVIPPNAIHDIPERDSLAASPPEPIRPYISDEVYIPLYITVHLGTPDSDAENVYVGFIQYIKNVASSEVYPTWPESALRANILAQISIALNRVYTEWYPSQGYDFQITSTTAYDQAFVKGRNTFANIDALVDELFNTFIRRRGFAEPLFAAYCDGRETSCAGMSQWGSFELASGGYNTLAILRYYYGDDIELVSTNNIRGIESTYGGVPLALGYASESVAIIQNQLNRIRQDFPTIPPIVNVNGVFDADTDAAVRRFQMLFDLRPDGIVGKATWYRISYIYAAVKKLAELSSEGDITDYIAPRPTAELTIGNEGRDVRTLQFLLDYISFFYDTVRPLTVDGVFGTHTRDALLSYQQDFGLDATGTTTPETWDSLYDTYATILSVIFPLEEDQRFPGELQYGSTGERVAQLQSYLNTALMTVSGTTPLEVDGDFGRATEQAVSLFQSLYGLPPTGTTDAETWLRLAELRNFLIRSGRHGA